MTDNISIRNGWMGALATIVFYLAVYFTKRDLYIHPGVYWGAWAITLVFLLLTALQSRREQAQGPKTFAQTLRPVFLTYVIIALFYYVFQYVLHHADPALAAMEKAAYSAHAEQMQAEGKITLEQYNAMRKYLAENDFQMRFRDILRDLPVSFLGGGFLSALLALLFKKA